MKRINLSCASPASTAVCVSNTMDQRPIVRQGGRAIDRHNPHLRDGRQPKTCTTTPPSSSSSSQLQSQTQTPKKNAKSCHLRKSKTSYAKPNDLSTTPPGSSRYLLSETANMDVRTDFDPLPSSLVSLQPKGSWPSVRFDECPPAFQQTSSSSSIRPSDEHQVVVLRVSLHCKGCEGKVRKHISKMKGVTSFNIDFAMKKVTVVGDVTPLGVLASISRVKNARFWPSLSSSSSIKPTCY